MDVATVDVPLANGHSFKVLVVENDAFAVLSDLPSVFGMSDGGFRGLLSKLGVKTVQNQQLQMHLEANSRVRFLNRAALIALCRNRLEADEGVAIATTLRNITREGAIAHSTPPREAEEWNVEEDDGVEGGSPMESERQQLDVVEIKDNVESHLAELLPLGSLPLPHLLAPTSVPIDRRDLGARGSVEGVPEIQVLVLPSSGSAWYLEDEMQIGKSYVLPEFDRGDALKEQLHQYHVFWLHEEMRGRKVGNLSEVTVEKRESRALLYLGFLRLLNAVDEPKMLTLNACLNCKAIQCFVEWQVKARDTSHGTLVEYLSGFISVVKFLHCNAPAEMVANNYAGVEAILRLREMRNRYQSKQRQVHKTEQDLTDEGRWLSWDSFQEAILSLHGEFNDVAEDELRPTTSSSRVLHDLVLLRLYGAFPARAGEVRLLQHMDWDDVLKSKGRLTVSAWVARERINLLSKRPDGDYTIWLADYKSFKHHGVDETSLPEETFPDLCQVLHQYLCSGYRRKLLPRPREKKHSYIFISNSGSLLSVSDFSKYLGGLVSRLTGCRATSNILRSSFVSNLLDSDAGADVGLRASAAALMRHSMRQQSEVSLFVGWSHTLLFIGNMSMLLSNMDMLLGIIYVSHTNLIKLVSQVYDRRTPNAKKRRAQSFLGKRQRASLDEDAAPSDASHGPLSPPPAMLPVSISHTSPLKHARASFFPGDLVVVPYVDSTTQEHAFWFAKVMSCTDMEARLMHLVPVDGASDGNAPALYQANIAGVWCEPVSACRHCDAHYDKEVQVYHLRTPRSAVLALAHPVDEK